MSKVTLIKKNCLPITVALKPADFVPWAHVHNAVPLLNISFWLTVRFTVWLSGIIFPTYDPQVGFGRVEQPPAGFPS